MLREAGIPGHKSWGGGSEKLAGAGLILYSSSLHLLPRLALLTSPEYQTAR